ncbi:metal ABC transporter solute-binding protein, Zn/Mn family [Prauserella endophytica]|uniref:Metal ABC transporter substrate-binding protein n=1 Tax=Prauserella endophytica TaxID=1592324 RepID=A0ABY2S3E6_9PSEU|nr:zinc ABC transporter substrate-binding protein [Prauserella endophytica]TKG70066.1 metal ABC transporter substrate-binding protein [Prauserella endophytica]
MSSRRARPLLATTSVLTALTLGLTACGGGGGGSGQAAEDGRISVVASTNVWGSVVEAVGGDRVDVKSIVEDPSSDPHSYQASAEDAADVQDAQLLVYNGGGYDEFFEQLAGQNSGGEPVVAFEGEGHAHGEEHATEEHGDEHATEGHGEEHATEQGGEEHGHDHGEVNEHVWYDLHVVAEVADKVAARLGELDAEAKQTFTDNANAFKADLDELTQRIEKIGTDHPGTKVVATEPVAHYLLQTAGITDATPHDYAEAIENETDVPVAAQQQVTELVSGKQVQAVVNNSQTVTPVTEKLVRAAKDAGVPVVDVTETLPEGATDYIAWMSTQVDALAGALGQ